MFGLNMYHTATQSVSRPFIPYTQSEINAMAAGFAEVQDERAYNGRYFVKNGKKWIHNLEALRKKLNAEYGHYICDEELSSLAPEGFGYDIETYYLYNSTSSEYNAKFAKHFSELVHKVHITH